MGMIQMIDVIKFPIHEDDDYLIKHNYFKIDQYEKYIDLDPYTKLKSEQFAKFDASKQIWLESDFVKDRPALRNINQVDNMSGSIYTVTCALRNIDTIHCYNHINFKAHYENCINNIKQMLSIRPKSRRIFMRMANSLDEYAASELRYTSIDTTCLAAIHYMEDSFKLIFRASDLENELLPDILTIYKYFIVPVYDVKPLTMTIYSSTSQNISHFSDAMRCIENLVHGFVF